MPAQNFTRKIDDARALVMYDDGASDSQIASALGVTASGICQWRRRHGLARVACNDNRLTSTQIRQAKNLLKNGATRAQIAAHLGISKQAVQRLRRQMDANGLRRIGLHNQSIRKAVINDNDLPRRIEKAIGLGIPKDIRMEAVNDMYLELLEGKLAVNQIDSSASRFRSKAFEMAGFNHSTRSLDEENEDGVSLADRLADPASLQPFEEVLKSVFANDD